MNIVKFEFGAFILPDDETLKAWMKEHDVEFMYLDPDEGSICLLRKGEKDWQWWPEDGEPRSVVSFIKRNEH